MKRLFALILVLVMALSACSTPQDLVEPVEQPENSETSSEEEQEEISPETQKINEILKDSEFYFIDEDAAALKQYYAKAEERKEVILNSPTEIVKADEFIRGETYTGTAYYISNNGNDENDGKSPETAWKSPNRFDWGDVTLQPGDAVFYERGSVFRLTNCTVRLKNDVTFSAYGEGAKPVFTYSKGNSAKEEYWELWYEDEAGVKIWKYHELLGDVGGITFNDEFGAKRVWEVPTAEGWRTTNVTHFDPINGSIGAHDPYSLSWWETTDEYRTVEENLTENMTYISRVDIRGITYPYNFISEYREGELYLRCDEGNPGTIFESINIAAIGFDGNIPITLVFDAWEATGYVLDNITVKYYLDNAVGGPIHSSRDAVIQNCTVEWGGNRLHGVASPEEWGSIGDGIYGVANNVIIRNNYFLQGNNGITFESSDGVPATEDMGVYLAEGNLFEECWQGIRLSFHDENDTLKMQKIILRDNIILNSGSNFDFDNPETPVAIDNYTAGTAKEIEIAENIIIGSRYALMRLPDLNYPNTNISIHDNVFAQNKDGILMAETVGRGEWYLMKDAK